ncbi:MAG TPA: 2OG-Fe(II) oxygenase [Burkholderiales bacterium]|jgi:predicted 2-oxoglutarate/Fe(II)-dependent dioxygenase YbiX|nr:2OG-Fe(II) oxygenase [Burkholderiales bacterium]
MPRGDEAQQQFSYVNLSPGEPAPGFVQRIDGHPEYPSHLLGGRYIVLCFFGSSMSPAWPGALGALRQRLHCFSLAHLLFLGVTVDARDAAAERLERPSDYVSYCLDFDGRVSRMFGALPHDGPASAGQRPYRQLWIVLDRLLRVVANIPFTPDGSDAGQLLAVLDRLPPFANTPEPYPAPPVLMLPDIFQPGLCERLIALFGAGARAESGFMLKQDSKTVEVLDPRLKRRRDYHVDDQAAIDAIKQAVQQRLLPEVAKYFQFTATNIERHLVARYTAEEHGHYAAHRDNTTPGTAHRRFAITINLNGDFEGGDLSFPEFGAGPFRVPVGGAIVFSCSMLHAAEAVTRGARYAYVTFLYDDAGARIRESNRAGIVALGARQ